MTVSSNGWTSAPPVEFMCSSLKLALKDSFSGCRYAAAPHNTVISSFQLDHVFYFSTYTHFLCSFSLNHLHFVLWSQEPKSDKDDEFCRKVNEYLNNPPMPGALGSGGSGGHDLSALGGNRAAQFDHVTDSFNMSNLLTSPALSAYTCRWGWSAEPSG